MQQQESSGYGRSSVHANITDEIVAAIAAGAPAFEMPWHRRGPLSGRPTNVQSKKPYRGINVLALWVAAVKKGYDSGVWATYRQWQSLDAQVRKGETGTAIVFFKEVERKARGDEPDDDAAATMLVARASWVFNAVQVTGWQMPPRELVSVAEVMNRAEDIVGAAAAKIEWGSERACYRPIVDLIEMPDRERFLTTSTSPATENFYATLLHELTHWTGHASRLNRDLKKRFSDEAYAMEELVAELGRHSYVPTSVSATRPDRITLPT